MKPTRLTQRTPRVPAHVGDAWPIKTAAGCLLGEDDAAPRSGLADHERVGRVASTAAAHELAYAASVFDVDR